MSDEKFLEKLLGMLPEEYQDIYDDTIPEVKKIRKKMSKKKPAQALDYHLKHSTQYIQ